MSNYQKDDDLLKEFSVEVGIEQLITTDSINENMLKQKIKTYKLDDQKLLLQISLQCAIVGMGGKDVGKIKVEGKILDLNNVLDALKITYNGEQNSKLREDDITVRRLTRIFRAHIRKFIEENNTSSYLWRKYSSLDLEYKNICFPGAEYLSLNKAQYTYLYETYKAVDAKLGTDFKSKIIRISIAKGIKLNN